MHKEETRIGNISYIYTVSYVAGGVKLCRYILELK